ncbi:MAG: hypothetical protein ACRD0J_02315 [Acidimicrobiales bacterium]
MKVSVQVVLEADDDTPAVVREVFTLERDALAPDTVGLRLDEAKGPCRNYSGGSGGGWGWML